MTWPRRYCPWTERSCGILRFSVPCEPLRAVLSASKPIPKVTKATLWEARLSDLQRLRERRFMDVQMADYRERWMFLSGVAMSWLAVHPPA